MPFEQLPVDTQEQPDLGHTQTPCETPKGGPGTTVASDIGSTGQIERFVDELSD